ncbi:hypothetical protein Scep_016705 [Stephania cephalantha]|uniref:Uncharacterized protein n=1 Tax=Stephania cephalantha TaxID=152367 RepID=A0AAP0NSW8_9MAGN
MMVRSSRGKDVQEQYTNLVIDHEEEADLIIEVDEANESSVERKGEIVAIIRIGWERNQEGKRVVVIVVGLVCSEQGIALTQSKTMTLRARLCPAVSRKTWPSLVVGQGMAKALLSIMGL